jgi:PAS domain S-box-containing protein
MSKKKVTILLVDDDEDDFVITRSLLRDVAGEQLRLDWARNLSSAKEQISKKKFDLYLIDYKLGKDSGLDFLNFLHEQDPDKPAIMLTGKGDIRIDQKAINLGAYDYLEKEKLTAGQLERSMRYALKHAETLRAFRDSEKKYRTVIEHSKEIIFILNDELKIVNISKAVEQYLGYTLSDIHGMETTLLFEDPSQMLNIIALVQENRQIQDFLLNVKTKTGETKKAAFSFMGFSVIKPSDSEPKKLCYNHKNCNLLPGLCRFWLTR